MNLEPLVSVIVTTYNRADLLCETLDSILNQTYTNFELIIVDDGSTDNTEEVVKKYTDHRLHYFKTDNWGGPARPRNIGINKAKGEYIAFCDDDDLWMENKLEKQLKHLDDGNIIGVGSCIKSFGNNKYFRNNNKRNDTRVLDFKDILAGQNVALSSLIVKRNNIRFSEDYTLLYVEDWDYQIQSTKGKKNIIRLPDVLVKYRLPTLTKSYPGKAENIINVIKMYEHEYKTEEINRRYSEYYRYMSLRYLKTGAKIEAISHLKYADSHFGNTFLLRILLILTPGKIIELALHFYYSVR